MPRQARLDAPGTLHHIMVRGINKSAIFKDDQDKTRFLERLGKIILDAECVVFAWVLMDNHAHILFKSGQKGMSGVMRKLLTWYAIYYNRRHHRSGHLFENRYKSILCEEENYLLALVRYIHLNPIRARIVRTLHELDRYPWSGHSFIMGNTKCLWMGMDYVLSQFSQNRRAAKIAYRKFIEEGMGMGHRPELSGGGLIRSLGGWSQVLSMHRKGLRELSDERILGSGNFVSTILNEAEEKEKRQLKFRQSGRTIAEIMEEECKSRQISLKELNSGSRRRKVSQTRAVVAYRGKEELCLSAAEIARHLGVSTSSITRTFEKMERKRNK